MLSGETNMLINGSCSRAQRMIHMYLLESAAATREPIRTNTEIHETNDWRKWRFPKHHWISSSAIFISLWGEFPSQSGVKMPDQISGLSHVTKLSFIVSLTATDHHFALRETYLLKQLFTVIRELIRKWSVATLSKPHMRNRPAIVHSGAGKCLKSLRRWRLDFPPELGEMCFGGPSSLGGATTVL